MKYIRDNLEDTYGILALQDKILEIMVYIDAFCKEHNIVYYLMGGSALGAMRHGGFIPWDDDLDIFMDYANYHKFMECCDKNLDRKHFYLQKEDSYEQPNLFSKIRMNGTACIEKEGVPATVHQGIFVDIMCLNNAATTMLGKKFQYYAAGLLKAKALTIGGYKTNNRKKKAQLLIAKYVVCSPVKKLLKYIVRRNNNRDTLEVAHLFGRAKFANSFYSTADFDTPRFVPFEKVFLSVPQNVEHYLETRYGKNYMQLPDEKTKAIYDGHAMCWDTERDYKMLLSRGE